MLLRVSVFPNVFIGIPPGAETQKLFCGLVLGILSDLCENGVLLVDDGGAVTGEYVSALSHWLVNYRKQVKSLLISLHKRNRIVRVPVAQRAGTPCPRAECRGILEVTLTGTPKAAIVSQLCDDCSAQRALGVPVVTVADYPLSEFHGIQRRSQTMVLGDGEIDKSQFEHLVLIPLFRDAKHIKFYDRYMGRSIVTRSRGGAMARRATMSANYQRTLEWMLEVFVRESNSTVTRTVEVYAGIDAHRRRPSEIQLAVNELRSYESQLQQRFGLSVRLLLHEESFFRSMVHARYVVTDQVGVFLDRGLDLLWASSQMTDAGLDPVNDVTKVRDVAISRLENCSHLDVCVRSLRALT